MRIHKVVDIISTSYQSFTDAAQNALTVAAEKGNIKNIQLNELNDNTLDGQTISYEVSIKVTFQ
ncbi:dodecin domain-containing protein [Cytophagaceae bacterium ABcell3]|nr:dodecin domain-containing protein [Cytophagaceae bacterium ABcell3]